MTKVHVSQQLNVPANEIWDLVGQWNALPNWLPAVIKSESSENGTIRVLTLAGGGTIEERLDHTDDSRRCYTYSLMAGPLPVANYKATVAVKDQGGGAATVEWSSDFEAHGASENEAREIIRDIYVSGLDNLKRMFGAV